MAAVSSVTNSSSAAENATAKTPNVNYQHIEETGNIAVAEGTTINDSDEGI